MRPCFEVKGGEGLGCGALGLFPNATTTIATTTSPITATTKVRRFKVKIVQDRIVIVLISKKIPKSLLFRESEISCSLGINREQKTHKNVWKKYFPLSPPLIGVG